MPSSQTPSDRWLYNTIGALGVLLMSWIGYTVDQSARQLDSDRLLFTQLQQGLTSVNQAIDRHQTQQEMTLGEIYKRIDELNKRVIDLEYRNKFGAKPP